MQDTPTLTSGPDKVVNSSWKWTLRAVPLLCVFRIDVITQVETDLHLPYLRYYYCSQPFNLGGYGITSLSLLCDFYVRRPHVFTNEIYFQCISQSFLSMRNST